MSYNDNTITSNITYSILLYSHHDNRYRTIGIEK